MHIHSHHTISTLVRVTCILEYLVTWEKMNIINLVLCYKFQQNLVHAGFFLNLFIFVVVKRIKKQKGIKCSFDGTTQLNDKVIELLFKYYSEESVEDALTTIENQVQLLRREIRGKKSVQDLQKTIDQLQKKLSTEKTAKEAALKDKEAALTR